MRGWRNGRIACRCAAFLLSSFLRGFVALWLCVRSLFSAPRPAPRFAPLRLCVRPLFSAPVPGRGPPRALPRFRAVLQPRLAHIGRVPRARRTFMADRTSPRPLAAPLHAIAVAAHPRTRGGTWQQLRKLPRCAPASARRRHRTPPLSGRTFAICAASPHIYPATAAYRRFSVLCGSAFLLSLPPEARGPLALGGP